MSTRSLARRADVALDRARLLPWPDLAALRLAVEAAYPAPDPAADPVGYLQHAYAAERVCIERGTAHTARPDYVLDLRFEDHLTALYRRALDALRLWQIAEARATPGGADGPLGAFLRNSERGGTPD